MPLTLVGAFFIGSEARAFSAERSAFLEAEQRLRQGDPAAAALLYAEASAQEGSSQTGMEARYRRAQALALLPGRLVEAVSAFRQFLEVDSATAPPRLVQVAQDELARLLSLGAASAEWEALEQLRVDLQVYPYLERVGRLEALIAASSAPEVRRAAFQMRVEEAWFAGDWTGVTRTLERQSRVVGPLSGAWREVQRQAEVELRRIALARGSVAGVSGALLAAGVRVWQRRRQGVRLGQHLGALGRLLCHWWATLALLYGFYWLGRRAGDVGPVVAQRMLVMTLLTSLGLVVTWILALPPRSRMRGYLEAWAPRLGISGARAATVWDVSIALLVHACMIYSFCYLYDYASVLGL